MILHNTTKRLIEGPKLLGASRRWAPGKTEIDDKLWAQVEALMAQYPTDKGKHLVQHLIDGGDIAIDKSGKKLPPPPTDEQLDALSEPELEKMAQRNDLPVTHAAPVVRALGRRAGRKN